MEGIFSHVCLVAIKIYTAHFTYRTLHTSNVASWMCYLSVIQWRSRPSDKGKGGGGGGWEGEKNKGGPPPPPAPNTLCAALRSKNKWGPGPPGPLPWIRHCYYVHNKGRNIVTHSHKDLTKKHEICEFCRFR